MINGLKWWRMDVETSFLALVVGPACILNKSDVMGIFP